MKLDNYYNRFFHIENMETDNMDVNMPLLSQSATMKEQFVGFVNRSAMIWFVMLLIAIIIIIIMSITIAVQKGMINRRNVTIAVEQSKSE